MTPDQIQRTYADLAELYDRQGQLRQRDWFLVLAADAAQSADRPGEADRLLGRLLSLNPHHFLKPFSTFAEALRSPDVQGYVTNLRRNYPPAKAAELLGEGKGKAQEEQRPDDGTLMPASRSAVPPAPLARKPTDEPEILFARVRGVPGEEPPAYPMGPEPEPPRAPLPAPQPGPTVVLPPLSPPLAQAPPPRPRPPQRVPPPQPHEPPTVAPPPKPARARAARQAPSPPATSPFVPSALFALLLLLGLGLAVYTFLRPFLPPEWLP
jgi:hypothetical protein